mgnify:CR=1 FL=1
MNDLLRTFFGRGKVVPILRGAGTEQVSQKILEGFLKQGEWRQMFGEGGRARTQDEIRPFKPGVGKFISETP